MSHSLPAIPELTGTSGNDWWTLQHRYEAFRLRWDTAGNRGWEALHRLDQGIWLRLINLDESAGSETFSLPGGYFYVSCKLLGANRITLGERTQSLPPNQLVLSYHTAPLTCVDTCPSHERYVMAILVMTEAALTRLLNDSASTALPGFMARMTHQADPIALCSAPLDARTRRCVNDMLQPPTPPHLLRPYLFAKAVEYLCLAIGAFDTALPLTPGLRQRDEEALARLCEHLEQRVADPPRLAELARLAGMSESKLKALFKRRYGMPISQHVQHLKCRRAEALLTLTDLSTDRIAAELGYEHTGNFITFFKRSMGTTPASYRRRHR
ncbi:helix-turn-helix domain-containing protein [Modicisalibacter coralii]|uniref:helix-turn-helix domain-containing protein n=1 Tax=Modicisalibacter coralii TaxID=2304602 RepID=UPI00100AB4D0|nr:AraC family transcriptional regulator [Halomonas coralii]